MWQSWKRRPQTLWVVEPVPVPVGASVVAVVGTGDSAAVTMRGGAVDRAVLSQGVVHRILPQGAVAVVTTLAHIMTGVGVGAIVEAVPSSPVLIEPPLVLAVPQ